MYRPIILAIGLMDESVLHLATWIIITLIVDNLKLQENYLLNPKINVYTLNIFV